MVGRAEISFLSEDTTSAHPPGPPTHHTGGPGTGIHTTRGRGHPLDDAKGATRRGGKYPPAARNAPTYEGSRS